MVVVDPNLTISDVNQEAVKLTGYTRRELIGSPLEAHFAVPARAEQGVREMLHTRAISTFDFVLKSRAGEERPIPVSAALFWDPDGEPRGLLVATGR